MSIYLIVTHESEQNKLFVENFGNAKNCTYEEEVVIKKVVPYEPSTRETRLIKNSLYIFDSTKASDAKEWLLYLKEHPYDGIELDVTKVEVELRINQHNALQELIPNPSDEGTPTQTEIDV